MVPLLESPFARESVSESIPQNKIPSFRLSSNFNTFNQIKFHYHDTPQYKIYRQSLDGSATCKMVWIWVKITKLAVSSFQYWNSDDVLEVFSCWFASVKEHLIRIYPEIRKKKKSLAS